MTIKYVNYFIKSLFISIVWYLCAHCDWTANTFDIFKRSWTVAKIKLKDTLKSWIYKGRTGSNGQGWNIKDVPLTFRRYVSVKVQSRKSGRTPTHLTNLRFLDRNKRTYKHTWHTKVMNDGRASCRSYLGYL